MASLCCFGKREGSTEEAAPSATAGLWGGPICLRGDTPSLCITEVSEPVWGPSSPEEQPLTTSAAPPGGKVGAQVSGLSLPSSSPRATHASLCCPGSCAVVAAFKRVYFGISSPWETCEQLLLPQAIWLQQTPSSCGCTQVCPTALGYHSWTCSFTCSRAAWSSQGCHMPPYPQACRRAV